MQQAVCEEQNHFTFRHQTATGKKRDVQLWSYPVQTSRGPLLFSTIRPLDAEAVAYEEALRAFDRSKLPFLAHHSTKPEPTGLAWT